VKKLLRKIGLALGALLFAGMVVYAFWHSLATPTGAVTGPPPTGGVPVVCDVLDSSLRERLVPAATTSLRDQDRHISACTLTGGGRQLRIEVTRHIPYGGSSGAELAQRQVKSVRDQAALLNRSFLPKLEEAPGLGDEALLARGSTGDAATATLTVRRGALVVVITYGAPPAPPAGRRNELNRYNTVVTGATEVARDVLARF
jgi:hypothetical protein